MERKKLMVLDGNSIVNRAFYGIRMLNAPDGTPTNAIYGFLTILERLLREQTPEALCVCFDVHAPTFRHELYDGYKAQRKPMPEELRLQMPLLKEMLDAMGIRRYELAGWEADDLLGSIAKRCEAEGWDCRLVTGDKDSLQLITEQSHVVLIKTRMGQTETLEYDPARFEEEYGFAPPKMVDLKALMGDSSDNIPGVAGIGEKTALELLRLFGSLAGVYAHLDDPAVKPAQRTKLQTGAAMAELSYTLATIVPEAPMDFSPEDNLWQLKGSDALYALCLRLGFGRFIEKWALHADSAAPVSEDKPWPEEIAVTPTEALARLEKAARVAVYPREGLEALELCDGEAVFTLRWGDGEGYNGLLRRLFSPEVAKIGENVKDLMGLCLAEGLSTEGFVFDTALAAYLLDATAADYPAEKLALKYLGREGGGAAALWALAPILEEKLKENAMTALYYNMELPLCAVLARMESEGFLVDKQALHELGQSLSAELERLQAAIWDAAGEQFNINSPKQLGVVLFERLLLPAGKKTKTGWSTNADTLEKLRDKHPIVSMVLEYRELSKLKSTYADGLLKVISPDGRIHTSFQMTVTATGRLSSVEPNLQNIPIRRPSGAALRRMFVAAPGNVLVDADYSQIELRLLAHMSGDERMIAGFLSGEDVHRITASQVFEVPLAEVTPLQRARAKAVNFGIVYGISAFSLAQDIGVYPNEAKFYIDTYLAKYAGVAAYMEKTIAEAKERGYVETLFGRRRALPELKSSNFNLRAFGERVARNMPIQGTAADLMKLAMLRVDERLRRELPEAKLLLQVHDELIVECPEALAERVRQLLEEELPAVADYAVLLTAEAKVGKSWADAH